MYNRCIIPQERKISDLRRTRIVMKYPNCRPVIVAPKIMLQPWEKEFQKWNVDIPVYNFDGQAAREQGKTLFHKHQEAAGNVQFALPKKLMLAVCREVVESFRCSLTLWSPFFLLHRCLQSVADLDCPLSSTTRGIH